MPAYTPDAVRTGVYLPRMQRLRPLNEEECYLRCYGWTGSGEFVKVLERDGPRDEESPSVIAERLRLQFEAALDERDREAA